MHDNQPEYYRAINAGKNDCGIFVDFMLNEILNALKQHTSCIIPDSDDPVLDFILHHPGCRANQISAALNIPLRTLQQGECSGKITYTGEQMSAIAGKRVDRIQGSPQKRRLFYKTIIVTVTFRKCVDASLL